MLDCPGPFTATRPSLVSKWQLWECPPRSAALGQCLDSSHTNYMHIFNNSPFSFSFSSGGVSWFLQEAFPAEISRAGSLAAPCAGWGREEELPPFITGSRLLGDDPNPPARSNSPNKQQEKIHSPKKDGTQAHSREQ